MCLCFRYFSWKTSLTYTASQFPCLWLPETHFSLCQRNFIGRLIIWCKPLNFSGYVCATVFSVKKLYDYTRTEFACFVRFSWRRALLPLCSINRLVFVMERPRVPFEIETELFSGHVAHIHRLPWHKLNLSLEWLALLFLIWNGTGSNPGLQIGYPHQVV
jgi:hypothetical protein